MGLLELQLKKIDVLEDMLDSGKISLELEREKRVLIGLRLKVTDQIIKIRELDVKANNNKTSKVLIEQGLIGGRTCIDMRREEREAETVRCPIDDHIITRAQCLEYSGGHMDECEKCHHFAETRKRLIDDVMFVRK